MSRIDEYAELDAVAMAELVSRGEVTAGELLDATAGHEPGAPYCSAPQDGPFAAALARPPRPLRIAFSTRAPNGVPVDPECVRAVEDAAALCRELGHEVEEAAAPFDANALGQAMVTIIGASTRALLQAAARQRGRDLAEGDLEPVTWRMIQGAGEVEAARYVDAVNAIHAAGRVAAAFHERYPVYLSPTLACPPVPLWGS